MKDYMIIVDFSQEALTKQVQIALNNGWKPVGGVGISTVTNPAKAGTGNMILVQAMGKNLD